MQFAIVIQITLLIRKLILEALPQVDTVQVRQFVTDQWFESSQQKHFRSNLNMEEKMVFQISVVSCLTCTGQIIFFFMILSKQIVYTTKTSIAFAITEMGVFLRFFLVFLSPPSRSATL